MKFVHIVLQLDMLGPMMLSGWLKFQYNYLELLLLHGRNLSGFTLYKFVFCLYSCLAHQDKVFNIGNSEISNKAKLNPYSVCIIR